MTSLVVRCVDCIAEGVLTVRPTPYGGPRTPLCATHHRMRKKARSIAAHERHAQTTYGLAKGVYQQLYDAQGGLCYICGPRTGARGATRRLTIDHDHACCPGKISCGRCVRGLVCAKCNEYLGYIRDDRDCFLRGFAYLVSPPARKVLHYGRTS